MADVTVKTFDEMIPMVPQPDGGVAEAPGSPYGFRRVRSELGLSAFGVNVIDMPPGYERYPDHDHAADGQEEVYVVLDGSATMQAGDEQFELTPGTIARVGAGQSRKLVPGENGMRLLCFGGVPGGVYEPA